MKRNGLLLAGGIIGIARGTLGTFSGLGNIPFLDSYNKQVPGVAAPLVFEFLLSLAILIVAVWVLVKANDQRSASMIKAWGVVIIVAGVVDMIWTIAVLGASSTAISSGLGSVIALSLIGVLLITGADRLSKQPESAE